MTIPERDSQGLSVQNLVRRGDFKQPTTGVAPKRPTAITVKPGIVVINIHSNESNFSHAILARIFSTLDVWQLSVDLMSTSEKRISLALSFNMTLIPQIQDNGFERAINELRSFGTVELISGMAILSLIGKQMKEMVDITGKMFVVLAEHQVRIEMISQGASDTSISCVIAERDADRAVMLVHAGLFTFDQSPTSHVQDNFLEETP